MPSSQRIKFTNARGITLAAALDLPDQTPRAFALLAHCFTCGMNNAAAARIARTLAAAGFGVLRFDFTGLGGSEGDFANTNFSSNLDDLVAAADWLREHRQAPELLIGHSFGGVAVLAAARRVPEVRALATIGSPSAPSHVLSHLGDAEQQIASEGRARVRLAGREFSIERQFIDDLSEHRVLDEVAGLRRALLIMHAPADDVVSIDEATRLFTAAKHPKSFVSLDGADHLLSDLTDAQYVARTLAAWAERYLVPPRPARRPEVAGGDVVVTEGNRRFLREVTTDRHHWTADEPRSVGGDDLGPDPYEHLLAALGTCSSMTIRMYANHKQWPLDSVTVRLGHSRQHEADAQHSERDGTARLEVIEREIRIEGALDGDQRRRLLQVADRCPVHRTLAGRLEIRTREVPQ